MRSRFIAISSSNSNEGASGSLRKFLPPYFLFDFFALDSATLIVFGVVSHIAAMSFGAIPARDSLPALSAKERLSGVMLMAMSLIRVSSLASSRAESSLTWFLSSGYSWGEDRCEAA